MIFPQSVLASFIIDDLQVFNSLSIFNSTGTYDESDSLVQLRMSVLKLETTRHMAIWHDHSDIAGKFKLTSLFKKLETLQGWKHLQRDLNKQSF